MYSPSISCLVVVPVSTAIRLMPSPIMPMFFSASPAPVTMVVRPFWKSVAIFTDATATPATPTAPILASTAVAWPACSPNRVANDLPPWEPICAHAGTPFFSCPA